MSILFPCYNNLCCYSQSTIRLHLYAVQLLLKAGLFDEALPSTTDRDLCIRICDVLSDESNAFVSTCQHTVVHYADQNRLRVSTPGSEAKVQGLTRFFLKHGARMTDEERDAFKSRARELFGCNISALDVDPRPKETNKLHAWSGEALPLSVGTAGLLPKLDISSEQKKRNALFGIITSDTNRVAPLLDDISASSKSPHSDLAAFVVLFVNSSTGIDDKIKRELTKRDLRGYVLSRESSNGIVDLILNECQEVHTSQGGRLPIALSRTILQVFIHSIIYYLQDVDAVVILDDDKRLPRGWSPFIADNGAKSTNTDQSIFIGRDLRTPPNPSIFSLRTNLIDLTYQLDLLCSTGAKQDIETLCLAEETIVDKYDWYYDLSSARHDHLEMPVFKKREVSDIDSFLKDSYYAFLRGTPLVSF